MTEFKVQSYISTYSQVQTEYSKLKWRTRTWKQSGTGTMSEFHIPNKSWFLLIFVKGKYFEIPETALHMCNRWESASDPKKEPPNGTHSPDALSLPSSVALKKKKLGATYY